MSIAIFELEERGIITHEEADIAFAAQAAGTFDHMVGYETEVLPTAAKDTPKIQTLLVEGTTLDKCWMTCQSEMVDYGYGVDHEGVYELKSPAARHPAELIIATRGIVRTGWLPAHARGTVTAHASISTQAELIAQSKTHRDLIRLLRAVEMLGATTAKRLLSPHTKAVKNGEVVTGHSWDQRGIAGVSVEQKKHENTDWTGKNNRAEFRTLRYHDAEGFGESLEALYYFTRGLLAGEETSACSIYRSFGVWFRNFQEDHDLPDLATFEDAEMFSTHVDNDDHIAYIKPFAEHLRKSDRVVERTKIGETVLALREEFGMTAIPSQFERQAYILEGKKAA